MSAADDAKSTLSLVFTEFNSFIRHIFSGLVVVVLYEAGNSGAKSLNEVTVIELSPRVGFCYAVISFVIGTIIYFFMRYIVADFIMYIQWDIFFRSKQK